MWAVSTENCVYLRNQSFYQDPSEHWSKYGILCRKAQSHCSLFGFVGNSLFATKIFISPVFCCWRCCCCGVWKRGEQNGPNADRHQSVFISVDYMVLCFIRYSPKFWSPMKKKSVEITRRNNEMRATSSVRRRQFMTIYLPSEMQSEL